MGSLKRRGETLAVAAVAVHSIDQDHWKTSGTWHWYVARCVHAAAAEFSCIGRLRAEGNYVFVHRTRWPHCMRPAGKKPLLDRNCLFQCVCSYLMVSHFSAVYVTVDICSTAIS